MELDVQQRDKYGRILAYVYVDGQMVNRTLVRDGYAEVATYPPNVRHQDEFLKLQREARTQRRGLWADEEARKHYKPRGSGVVGRKSFRAYYHPTDPDLAKVAKEDLVYFENEAEANQAGYAPSMSYGYYRSQDKKFLVGDLEEPPKQKAVQESPSSTPTYSNPAEPKSGEVEVRGYYRKDGTYVPPHRRSAPKR